MDGVARSSYKSLVTNALNDVPSPPDTAAITSLRYDHVSSPSDVFRGRSAHTPSPAVRPRYHHHRRPLHPLGLCLCPPLLGRTSE